MPDNRTCPKCGSGSITIHGTGAIDEMCTCFHCEWNGSESELTSNPTCAGIDRIAYKKTFLYALRRLSKALQNVRREVGKAAKPHMKKLLSKFPTSVK